MLTSKDKTLTITTEDEFLIYIRDHSVKEFLDTFSTDNNKSNVGRKSKTEDAEYRKELKYIIENNLSIEEIEKKYNVSQSTAFRMRRKARLYADVNDKKDKPNPEKVTNDSDRKKPRSFSMSDKTYNTLLELKEKDKFYGSVSDYLSFKINNLKPMKRDPFFPF